MADDQRRKLSSRQPARGGRSPHAGEASTPAVDEPSAVARWLADDRASRGSDNPAVRPSAFLEMQQTYGNHLVQRLLERQEAAPTRAVETLGRRPRGGVQRATARRPIQRTPAAPSGTAGAVVRDLGRIRIDPVPDLELGAITTPRVVNPHVVDPLIKHLTWEFYDPKEQTMSGNFSTLPTSPTATTKPYTIKPSLFTGPDFTPGKYLLRCTGLDAHHQPIAYADRDINVTKADLKTGTPLATTYGELTFTKYDKTDASPPGTGSWLVDVELKFLPKSTVASDDIAFIQAQESVDSTGKSQHRFTSPDQDARQTPLAWSIDRVAGAPSPFYIMGHDPAGKVVDVPGWGKKGKGGATPSEATLIDKPSWNGETYDKFESCVIARSGPNKGQVYGCATWGYTTDSQGKVTLMPRTFHEMPSDEFVEAREAWNKWRTTVPAAARPDEAPALKSP